MLDILHWIDEINLVRDLILWVPTLTHLQMLLSKASYSVSKFLFFPVCVIPGPHNTVSFQWSIQGAVDPNTKEQGIQVWNDVRVSDWGLWVIYYLLLDEPSL